MEVKDTYVADVTRYSGPLREAASSADKFKDKNEQAALAARRMGLAAKEAADKAARAQRDAADAAEKLARGELKADEAAKAAARAENELERASIKAAEAQRAAGRAADAAAANFKQMARDAALGAAAEDLAMLKASGRVKEHNALLKNLESRYGDLSKEGSGAFRAIETDAQAAGTQLSGMGPAITVGVVNALALLPEAATVAGNGIVLGLGGALTAIGLKAQAGSADVRRTFSKLKSDVSGDLKKISTPFHETWLRIAADADHAFHELEPSLKGAFAAMAPAVNHFESTVISALSGPRVQAAIDSLGKSFGPILDALGPATASAIGDVADGIKSIADAAAQNPQALAGIVNGIGQITKVALEGVGALIKYKTGIEDFIMVGTGGGPLALYKLVNSLNAGTRAILGTDSGFKTATRTFPTFSQQATAAAAASGHLMSANQAAALSANQLKTAMDNLTGKTLTEREALIQYRSAITQMNQALKDNGHAHGFATQKGAQNEQALDGLAVSAQKVAQAMRDEGRSSKDVSAYLEGARQRIVAAAEKMGYGSQKAKELAASLLGIKAPPPIKLSLNDQDFMAKWHVAQGLKLDPKTGFLKGNNSDYYNKWLRAKGLKLDPKTGLFKGNNSDYYNKWLAANHLRIDTKTGRITGNTSAFWSAVHSIPPTVGYRQIGVYYVPLNSANQPGTTRHADGGIDRYADGGVRRDLPPFIATRPTVLFGETETGGEAYIPLGQNKRARSTELLSEVADMFGLALVKPMVDGAVDKFAKGGGFGIGKMEQKQIARLHAAAARVHLAKARPEYLAAMAAQHALESMRRSVFGGIFRGGPATVGSAHGTVVQHTTNLYVTVQGSVQRERDLARSLANVIATHRIPVTLPAGR